MSKFYLYKTNTTIEFVNPLLQIYNKFKSVANHKVLGRYFQSMLFFKYVSDFWKYTLMENERLFGNDKELLERKMKRERFILTEDITYDYVSRYKLEPDIGEIINKALSQLVHLNYDKFDGIFGHVDFNSEYDLGNTKIRNEFLSNLLQYFDSIDLMPSNPSGADIIDECISAIENLTEVTSRKGDDFYTPKEICLLLARILQPKSGSRIYDPVCGSGSLLIAAAESIKGLKETELPDYSLYGQDINKEIVAWAKMNMYLHGLDGFKIAWGNVITDPAWKEGNDNLFKFDIVISNPPFSVDSWDIGFAMQDPYQRFKWGVPPKTRGDYAFIQHMLASTDKDGRVGVIIPQSLLFREGKESSIRQGIIKENLLETVISLPTNLFYHTTVPCAIMLFNKAKKENKNILFIDASKEYLPGKTRNSLRQTDMENILEIYRLFKDKNGSIADTAGSKNYSVATIDQIASQDYNLTVSRYVQLNTDNSLDIVDLKNEIRVLESELKSIESELQSQLTALGLM